MSLTLAPIFFSVALTTMPFMVTSLGIIGGKTAGLYPFFVLVINGDEFCGGTLITADAVLTAAHCLYNVHRDRWARDGEILVVHVNFSDSMWLHSDAKESFICQQYASHELYDPIKNNGTGPYDIAVIKLPKKLDPHKSNFSVLQPCYIDGYYKQKNNYGIAIGMGKKQQEPEEFPEVLMEATLRRHPNCGSYFWQSNKPNWQIQACYSIPGKAATCEGDSGGPLVRKQKRKVVCLIGISSYTKRRCDHPNYPAVFTLVGPFRNWIYNQLRKLDSHIYNE